MSVEPVVTKAANSISVSEPEELLEDPNFSLSGRVSVEPLGATPSTKATIAVPGEITRDNLTTFYVNGFLDVTNPHVTEGAQFISKAPATFDANASSPNRDIKGRWFFTPKNQYQWRTRINHYFWACSEEVLTNTKDNLEFDFDTETMSKDLVVAYHEQYWDDKHCTDDADNHPEYDELGVLPFKHAVAAVALNNSMEFKKLIKDAKPGTDGKYADSDLGPNEYKEGDSRPRLELTYAGIRGATSGHVKATPDQNFEWSKIGGYTKGVTTAQEGTSTYFMVPQLVNTTSELAEGAIAVFNIRDNRLTKSQDFPIPLPSFTSGTAAEYWLAGNYYKYIFNGRFIAPFVPDSQPDGYPSNFYDNNAEINMAFAPMNFSYLNHINVKWTTLGSCDSNGYHIYMVISPYTPEEVPFNNGTAKNGEPIILIGGGQTKNAADFIKKSGNIVFFDQEDDGKKVIINKCSVGDLKIGGKITNPPVSSSDRTTYYNASYEVNNIDVSGLEGSYYVYIVYSGGNSSNACWVLQQISLEIVD